MTDRDRIELGLELLAHFEDESLSVAAVIDRLETLTTDPRTTRQILERAAADGVIERDGGMIRPVDSKYLSFESEVITKEGEFTCRRCGASLSTGYFMNFESGEHGPFGSSCIRKVTGRE
ncbi:MAG: DUF5830 family protein [Halodesulfurarchaeum sp.]|nr:DUF5830 family protein [Halodesulfurarchaeum sp.]